MRVCVSARARVCVCVCSWGGGGRRGTADIVFKKYDNYYVYIHDLFRFYVYIIVDVVKRGVLPLVVEIPSYRLVLFSFLLLFSLQMFTPTSSVTQELYVAGPMDWWRVFFHVLHLMVTSCCEQDTCPDMKTAINRQDMRTDINRQDMKTDINRQYMKTTINRQDMKTDIKPRDTKTDIKHEDSHHTLGHQDRHQDSRHEDIPQASR